MHCEKDTELMAKSGGRCRTTLDCEECVGCHLCSRMYCEHCRSRTGNAFSADVGCRTFKRDELARHERIFHPKKLGSGNVRTMLSNEAERVKQTRIRTILAVCLMITTRYGCLLRKSEVTPGVSRCLRSCCRGWAGWAGCVGEGWGEREEKTSQLGPFVFGQIPGL
jgi:hypothetical protein